MKMNVEIECTPIEFRQLLGLPDVEPMQKAILDEVGKRIMADMDRFSHEGLLKAWLTPNLQALEPFQNLFGAAMAKGQGK